WAPGIETAYARDDFENAKRQPPAPNGTDGDFPARCYTKRLRNLSAVSATSPQPLSIVNACPRIGISTIFVTPSLCSCCLKDACAIAHGTVLSFSPEIMSSGPRCAFFVSTFASVHGFRLAAAA